MIWFQHTVFKIFWSVLNTLYNLQKVAFPLRYGNNSHFEILSLASLTIQGHIKHSCYEKGEWNFTFACRWSLVRE